MQGTADFYFIVLLACANCKNIFLNIFPIPCTFTSTTYYTTFSRQQACVSDIFSIFDFYISQKLLDFGGNIHNFGEAPHNIHILKASYIISYAVKK